MPAHALLPAVNRLLQQVEETSGLICLEAEVERLTPTAVLQATRA